MRGYRILKRKKNTEIEYLTQEQKERYYKRIIIINVLLIVGLLLGLILI